MKLYDVLSGYWKSGNYVFAVTDDLSYARTLMVGRAEREAGVARVRRGLSDLETKFAELVSGAQRRIHVNFGDYHYEIRESQLVVAIGGLSTVPT